MTKKQTLSSSNTKDNDPKGNPSIGNIIDSLLNNSESVTAEIYEVDGGALSFLPNDNNNDDVTKDNKKSPKASVLLAEIINHLVTLIKKWIKCKRI